MYGPRYEQIPFAIFFSGRHRLGTPPTKDESIWQGPQKRNKISLNTNASALAKTQTQKQLAHIGPKLRVSAFKMLFISCLDFVAQWTQRVCTNSYRVTMRNMSTPINCPQMGMCMVCGSGGNSMLSLGGVCWDGGTDIALPMTLLCAAQLGLGVVVRMR